MVTVKNASESTCIFSVVVVVIDVVALLSGR